MTTHRDLTTPELRPCPWCAPHGSPLAQRLDASYTAVLCGCGAEGPPGNTELHAIENWNRRPRTFTAAEVAEAMQSCVPEWADDVSEGDAGYNAAVHEMNRRIIHWLRENEG